MCVPEVKLEHEFAILHDLFALTPSMVTSATDQQLVSAAAALYVSHGNERLNFHIVLISEAASCEFLSHVVLRQLVHSPCCGA